MNIPRYIFRKESEPDVLNFIKAVKECGISTSRNARNETWEGLLPASSTLQEECTSSDLRQDPVTSSTSQEEPQLIAAHKTSIENSHEESFFATANLSEIIREYLETEGNLPADFIQKIASECPARQIQELFVNFYQQLSFREVHQLGMSLMDNNELLRSFYKEVLIKKLCEKHDTLLSNLLNDCLMQLEVYATGVISDFLIQMSEQSHCFDVNLTYLKEEQKNGILKMYASHSQELKMSHFSTLEVLLTSHIDESTINHLLRLIGKLSNDSLNEKRVGKFLFSLCTSIGNDLHSYQDGFGKILENHTSIWNRKLNVLFANNVGSVEYSQQIVM